MHSKIAIVVRLAENPSVDSRNLPIKYGPT
jgi:hypothetical protein